MRAAVYQGPALPHRIENVAEPIPAASEVIVRVERCGICGSDLVLTKSNCHDSPLGAFVDRLFAPGAILGHEISGEVVALGSKVQRLRVGDRIAPMFLAGCGKCRDCLSGKPNWCQGVYGRMGGYAEYALANENFCIRLEENLSADLAALIEPLATSLHAVTLARLVPGSKVLVLGAGAVGLGIAYFARRLGAHQVMVVARTERRRELALALGATEFRAQGKATGEAVSALFSGPPDVVFEAAGAAGVINQAIDWVKPSGLIVSAGICMAADPTFHAAAMMKELRIQYAMAYELGDFRLTASYLREAGSPLARLVTARVSLDAFPGMFDALRNGQNQCKVLVAPGDSADEPQIADGGSR